MVVAAAIYPPAANGAAVQFEPDRPADSQIPFFRAFPGEVNRLAVSATQVSTSSTSYVFRDTGATLRARVPCSLLPTGAGQCIDRGSHGGTVIHLGDRGDRALVSAPRLEDRIIEYRIYAGPGNDVITVGPNAAAQVFGSLGDDQLNAAAGNGVHLVGGPGSDRMIGSRGRDTVSYGDHRSRVRIDLRRPGPQGSAGERDYLYGVEEVTGGPGPDIFIGGPRPDEFVGFGGNDYFNVAGGGADVVFCHAGFDTVRADRSDRLHDCDRVRRSG